MSGRGREEAEAICWNTAALRRSLLRSIVQERLVHAGLFGDLLMRAPAVPVAKTNAGGVQDLALCVPVS